MITSQAMFVPVQYIIRFFSFLVTHLHPQTQHQQITVTALPEQYNPTISVPASNSPTIINNTYYAAGTVAASAAAAALAAAGGPAQTATMSNHNNAQQNTNITNRSQQGTNQQPKSYTAGRRKSSNLPTSSTGDFRLVLLWRDDRCKVHTSIKNY